MFKVLIAVLIIYLFFMIFKEGLIDPSLYMIGNEPVKRGSPNLTGWNLSSLYSKKPIIVDDLSAMY